MAALALAFTSRPLTFLPTPSSFGRHNHHQLRSTVSISPSSPIILSPLLLPPSRTSHIVKCSALSSLKLDDQFAEFAEAAKNGNLIPLYRCVFSDHITPVLAFRCLVKEDERDAPSFLFESVEPGLFTSSCCLVKKLKMEEDSG